MEGLPHQKARTSMMHSAELLAPLDIIGETSHRFTDIIVAD
jgi:hypothetical protein